MDYEHEITVIANIQQPPEFPVAWPPSVHSPCSPQDLRLASRSYRYGRRVLLSLRFAPNAETDIHKDYPPMWKTSPAELARTLCEGPPTLRPLTGAAEADQTIDAFALGCR